MEQRRLRLGDILDDYCPRERRVTNHAIVAMIEEEIKQTRCTTCDAEHAYKGAKLPRRRKPETPAALYKEVLAGMPESDGAPVLAVPATIPVHHDDAADVIPSDDDAHDEEAESESLHTAADEQEILADDDAESMPSPDEGPVHRPLIRATLPRPEGQKDARPLPEFTIRQSARPGSGNFRGARAMRGQAPAANGNGNRAGGQRFQGPRAAGQGRGPAGGGRGAQARGQGGGFRGRKRSR
jgi:hypothetical protein